MGNGAKHGWIFTEEEIQMADKHMKRCSIILMIRKVKIKGNASHPHL